MLAVENTPCGMGSVGTITLKPAVVSELNVWGHALRRQHDSSTARCAR